jgi:hypothetical protein
VITSIGGEELYGKHPEVALRELIQNACDSVRAHRFYEKRDPSFGRVVVSLIKEDDDTHPLEVVDTGVGMSQRVLTDFLLNFGRSFWGSAEMQEEFPGLLSSGVKPTGKYGIGFFSVFMVAKQVRVITRRSDAGARDTLVLEFSEGVEGRPILRPASREEQLIDGGTSVKLRLMRNPEERGGLLRSADAEEPVLFPDLRRQMRPALDVDLLANMEGKPLEKLIGADDWKTVDVMEFLGRFEPYSRRNKQRDRIDAFCRRIAPNLRLLCDDQGEIVGRAACIAFQQAYKADATGLYGAVTVGGLKACNLQGIVGILPGRSLRASRDTATPLVNNIVLSKWASEQAEILMQICDDPEMLYESAKFVRLCLGSTNGLPVARHRGSWVTAEQIAEMALPPDVAILVHNYSIEQELKHVKSYDLDDSVFVTETWGITPLIQGEQPSFFWPRDSRGHGWKDSFYAATLGGVVLEALCKAWKVPVEVVANSTDFHPEDVPFARVGDRVIATRGVRIVKPSWAPVSSSFPATG